MLRTRPQSDIEYMRTAAPTRAPVAPARDNTRISRQIRRFALLWLISAAFVLVAITLAGYVSSGYRDEASARAKASTEAQLTVARLRAAIEQQANDRIAYDLTGAAAYFEAFQRHANTTARLAVELRRDMGAASGDEGEQRLLTTTLEDLERWLAATDSAMAASNRDRRAGLPPQHSPRVDATANALLEDLAQLDAQLPKQAARSIAGAGETADEVRLIRQVATLAGLILLLAGGIRLVRQAYGLAAEAGPAPRARGALAGTDGGGAGVERARQERRHSKPADRIRQCRTARRAWCNLLSGHRGSSTRASVPWPTATGHRGGRRRRRPACLGVLHRWARR